MVRLRGPGRGAVKCAELVFGRRPVPCFVGVYPCWKVSDNSWAGIDKGNIRGRDRGVWCRVVLEAATLLRDLREARGSETLELERGRPADAIIKTIEQRLFNSAVDLEERQQVGMKQHPASEVIQSKRSGGRDCWRACRKAIKIPELPAHGQLGDDGGAFDSVLLKHTTHVASPARSSSSRPSDCNMRRGWPGGSVFVCVPLSTGLEALAGIGGLGGCGLFCKFG